MGFFGFLKELFARKHIQAVQESIYEGIEEVEAVHSLWDYLKFQENSQAFHLTSVIGFEEWIIMEEIKRRIREIYGVEYKNERSLYPYLKTLVDCGLIETTSAGGKRKWRKKELVISLKQKKKKELEKAIAVS